MIADGTEEVECLAVVDILRRAGVETELVSACGKTVVGSHGITITADRVADDLGGADLLFVPGGKVGSEKLAACEPLVEAIGETLRRGARVAAICAAPALVLGAHGFLRDRRAVCYPGFEARMLGATVVAERVVTDGNITTARGMGCSIELGIELVRLLVGEETAKKIAASVIADGAI